MQQFMELQTRFPSTDDDVYGPRLLRLFGSLSLAAPR